MSEDATEATEATETTRRGRPRPQATLDRDAQVLGAIQSTEGPVTRDKLVEATGMPANQVYLSLYRLRRDGAIVRGREGGAHTWSVVTDEAAPVG